MESRSSRRLRSFVLQSLPLALVLLLLSPAPALALGDWIGIEGSLWRQAQSGDATISGDIFGGTNIDFQDTLNLEENVDTYTGRLWFRFGRNRLVFDYFDSTRSGDTILSQSFVFNDTIYTAGQSLHSDLDVRLYQAKWLFSVADLKVVDVGVGLGAEQVKFKGELDGSVSGLTTLDESVPYPTLAAHVVVKPVPAFHIRVELNGMRGTVSGTHVEVQDARAQLELYIAHVLGFFAGYRQYRFDFTDPSFGSVENTFKGPYVGLGLKF
jgi:hypothetical protein